MSNTFLKIKQDLYSPEVKNIPAAMKKALSALELGDKIKPGMRIAVTVGSRGINNIQLILTTIVEWVKSHGGEPFMVAAMGSHGGGTEDGMRKVLRDLGITEEKIGVPLAAKPTVTQIGRTAAGLAVYCAQEAVDADGVIVVNRIKPHTAMLGKHESGLLKMMTVGLGRAPGAESMHYYGPQDMSRLVLQAAELVLQEVNILGGIGLVENAEDKIAVIEGFKKEEIIAGDRRLLTEAKKMLPILPVDEIDFLVVKEMGKNYSGTGMDTNVIGRWKLDGIAEPEKPAIKRIAVLDLSDASHGNANGIGLADFTTSRLFQKIDFEATYLNGLTTNFLRRIRLPIILQNDKDVFRKGLASLRSINPNEARIMIIDNTLHLGEMLVSAPLGKELENNAKVSILERNITLQFDEQGNLALCGMKR